MPEERPSYRGLDNLELVEQLRSIREDLQNKNFTLVTTAPTVKTLDKTAFQLYWDGSTLYLYTRRVDTLYRVALTAV